jgi:hypothetical protein
MMLKLVPYMYVLFIYSLFNHVSSPDNIGLLSNVRKNSELIRRVEETGMA